MRKFKMNTCYSCENEKQRYDTLYYNTLKCGEFLKPQLPEFNLIESNRLSK